MNIKERWDVAGSPFVFVEAEEYKGEIVWEDEEEEQRSNKIDKITQK